MEETLNHRGEIFYTRTQDTQLLICDRCVSVIQD